MLKIYIANLGKYNEGELVGEWITLPATNEELEQLYINIKVAHRNDDGDFIPYYEEDGVIYEETAIHDYESEINGLEIGEYDSIDKLNELAAELDELDDYDIKVIEAIIEGTGYDFNYALEHRDDAIFYENMDLEDVAREHVDEGLFGKIPESIINYIDYEAIARDLSCDGYYKVYNGVIHLQ